MFEAGYRPTSCSVTNGTKQFPFHTSSLLVLSEAGESVHAVLYNPKLCENSCHAGKSQSCQSQTRSEMLQLKKVDQSKRPVGVVARSSHFLEPIITSPKRHVGIQSDRDASLFENGQRNRQRRATRSSSVYAVDARACLPLLVQTTISFASFSWMWLRTASPFGKKWSIVAALWASIGEASGGGGKLVCRMSAQ